MQFWCSKFSEDTYCEIVKGFLKHESIKDLAALVVEAKMSEPEMSLGNNLRGLVLLMLVLYLGCWIKHIVYWMR